jgi:Asp-tRNA(Asn)/Glu-tRNA(Gln) amidotransferase A subunit family amidase
LEDADNTYRVLRAEGYLTTHLDTYRVNPGLLGPLVKANVEEALSYSYEDFARANTVRAGIYRRFQDYFGSIDILICPTTSVAPFPVEELYPTVVNGKAMSGYMEWLGLTYGLTLTGHPVLAMPCGRDRDGLPFSIQVCGPRRSDLWLLSVGIALERCFKDHPELVRPRIA